MSTDIGAIANTGSQKSLVEKFGEYYRNSDNGDLLKNIFEEAEKKIHAGKTSKGSSIFGIGENLNVSGNGKTISFVSNGTKNTRIIKHAAKPQVLNIVKNIHKLGKRGGYAALAIGTVLGLYLLFKPNDEKPENLA